MNYSIQAVNMIKNFEGLRLVSYKCLPTEKKWTIGYGHYGVKENATITPAQATKYLEEDLNKKKKLVDKYDKIYSFNQNQYDALMSFAYNVGSIDQLTHKGTRSKDEIGKAMLLYSKSAGRMIPGLLKRRSVELMLYSTPIKGEEKSASQLAKEVIQGKWGSGEARRIKLEACGYDYKQVQRLVNAMLP